MWSFSHILASVMCRSIWTAVDKINNWPFHILIDLRSFQDNVQFLWKTSVHNSERPKGITNIIICVDFSIIKWKCMMSNFCLMFMFLPFSEFTEAWSIKILWLKLAQAHKDVLGIFCTETCTKTLFQFILGNMHFILVVVCEAWSSKVNAVRSFMGKFQSQTKFCSPSSLVLICSQLSQKHLVLIRISRGVFGVLNNPLFWKDGVF